MSVPEPEGIAGVIPPAANWVVGTAWRGLFDRVQYDDPYACFAANRTCEQVFTREPIPYHCRPVTYRRCLRPDLDADDPACDFYYGHADSDANADPLRGNAAGGTGDGDGDGDATGVRADNGDTGGDEAVLLDGGPAHANRVADPAAVPDAGAGNALREE